MWITWNEEPESQEIKFKAFFDLHLKEKKVYKIEDSETWVKKKDTCYVKLMPR